jgi:hypothetical protein
MLDAGSHSLVVAKDGVGTPFTKWFDASAGSAVTIDANLLPPAPPPLAVRAPEPPRDPDLTAAPKPAPASRHWAKVAGFTTGGLAVAALGFGTVEWVIKELRFRDFNSRHCDKALDNFGGDGCIQLNDQGARAKTLGYVGFAAAGVLGAASTIFFVVGRDHATGGGEELSLACAPSLTLPGAACRLTF